MARRTMAPSKKRSSVEKRSRKKPRTYASLSSTRSIGPTPKLQSLCFILQINTTNTSPQQGMLMNRFEEEDSEVVSISAGSVERYNRELNEFIELTHEEKQEAGFMGKELTLESVWKTMDSPPRIVKKTTRRTYKTRNDFFSIAEVVKIVEKFERIDRPKSKWFGGVDCHHVHFEGLRLNSEGDAFAICWGS